MGEGFILGLSTGAVCVAYCGPVLIPYLMSESGGLKKSYILVAIFLAGRLSAYLLTALLAGIIGQSVVQQSDSRTLLMGIAYMILSAMLIAYGLYRFKEICLGHTIKTIEKDKKAKDRFLIPLTGGFLTGINICPPFLLAITGAIDSGTIGGSIMFFLAFFAGTSVYFLPMPVAGMFKRQHVLRIIGKFAALLAGILYFYKGLILLIR
ncbi:MAG TPA: sulfite exporter TauE/SafE family protein [Bacteroidales bacterium]|nr:sulfite exporter TauE/SafE family protein [Bacteroidales bacterium]HPT12321.1 sulfite exporter TauE/SafE family protein [Bacteroidales bacterium]